MNNNKGGLVKYAISIAKTLKGIGNPIDKKRTIIVALCAAIISSFFSLILMYIIVTAPVAAIQEGIHKVTNVTNAIGSWFSKLGNFFTGYGWVGDEEAFANALNDQYYKYENNGVCIDDTAISSVLIYKFAISNDVDLGNDALVGEETSENNDYDKAKGKVDNLAKAQVYNNSISNADFLAYLRTGKKATNEERQKMNTTTGSSLSTNSTIIGQKYDLTDEQLRGLAAICQREQGTVEGAAAEASLIANQFEILENNTYGTGGDGLYNYVSNSGWFGNGAGSYMQNNASSVSNEILEKVRDVLVNGNRSLPIYVNEHDCIYCGIYGYDVISASNNGVEFDVNDRSQYKKDVTKIKNRYGSTYTFYSFPYEGSDPFGYTDEAYLKYGGTQNGEVTSATSAPVYTDAPRSTSIDMQVITIDEPNLGRIQTYTRWDEWAWAYDAKEVINALGGQNYVGGGYISNNDYGIITYGQWYAAAMTSTFGKVGDMVFVVQDDGSVFPVIIADEKSQQYVDWDHNPANKWGHNNGQNIVEFQVKTGSQAESSGGNVPGPNNEFDHYIKSVINVGSVFDTPEYIDNVEQALSDAGLSGVKFIDVGSVTYDGFSATGLSSSQSAVCPGNLEYFRPTDAEIKSTDYTGGFIYKYYKDIFKNYEGEELNYAVENLIREIYEYKDTVSSSIKRTKKSGSSTYACNVTGDFESWLQGDPKWKNIKIGNTDKTIGSIGCYATSVAMLIRKSGTQLNVDEFNPGVFVETLNRNGGFSGALFANNPSSWSSIAPNFTIRETNVPLTGDREAKTKKLKELSDAGYYIIISVKPNQGHWVALNKVEGDTVYIMDPASNKTKLWDEIYEVGNTNTYTLFTASDSASSGLSSSGICAPANGNYNYYNQAAGDGSDGTHFGSYKYKCRDTNINSSGCGPSSIAIVASGIVSSDITPITVVDAMCDSGWSGEMSPSWMNNEVLMSKLGMNATLLFDSSSSLADKKAKIVDIISKGYPVIIDNPNHYVALIQGSNGKIKMLDPGSKENTKEYTIDELTSVTWHGSNEWRTAYYYSKRS